MRHDAFPALNLARKASVEGDDRPIILNAANEVAVEAFLNGQISFTAITEITADCLNQIAKQSFSSINDVLSLDNMCRRIAERFYIGVQMITTIIATIVALGVLVTVHEFGHYWVAKRCDV